MASYNDSLPPNLTKYNEQTLLDNNRGKTTVINGIQTHNTDRHDAFANRYNRNNNAMADYTNDSMMFNMSSPMNDERFRKKYGRLKRLSEETKTVLKEVSNDIEDPATGKDILNADYNNLWFSQHVYMLFSLGRVFDKNDSNFFDSVVNYFNQENEIYLGCSYDIMNYKDDLVKKIEQQIGIENGNYHLLLVLIVYANDAELEHTQEYLFSTSGIVKWAIESDEIKDIMLTFLNRYGIATEAPIPHKIPQRISGRRDDNTLINTKFNLHSDVDWNSEPNRMLFSDIAYRNNGNEEFAARTGLNEDTRINGKRERVTRNRLNTDSLYNRMYEESKKASTVPIYGKQVVISKMVENVIPSEYIGAHPYVMDDEEENYSKVRNYQIYEDRNKTKSKTPAKQNVLSTDYSMLYDYGIDSSMDLKSTGVKRPPSRIISNA